MCQRQESVSLEIPQNQIVVGRRNVPKKTSKIKELAAVREAEAEARRQIIASRKAEDQEMKEWRLQLEKFKIPKSYQFKKTISYLDESIKKSPEARQKERDAHRKVVAKNREIFQKTKAMKFHLRKAKSKHLEQTDTYSTVYERPESSQTLCAQTEAEDIFVNSEVPTVTAEACTQVDAMKLFNFEKEVTPIAETMIKDVLGQAINEILYKSELAATARHQRTLYLERTTAELKMLAMEREDKMTTKTIADHTKLFDEGEKNEQSRISKLPPSYGVDFQPRVDLDLNQNISTIDTQAEAESLEFVSCLINDLQVEKTKNITIEDFVKNIRQDRMTVKTTG